MNKKQSKREQDESSEEEECQEEMKQSDSQTCSLDTKHARMAEISKTLQTKLLEWYHKNKRTLPWRKELTDSNLNDAQYLNQRAYEVWISEIMLQQTRVEAVKDYYIKWMKKFPTVKDLAQSDEETVLGLWSGLGYYSRAKNIFITAKEIVNNKEGLFPTNQKGLLALKGIGEYTAGAISSIAFGKREALVDGNVMRVLARLQSYGEPINQRNAIQSFWKWAKLILPEQGDVNIVYSDFNQALMEFGALVCVPKSPKCESCPLQSICKAYEDKQNKIIDSVEIYPQKKKKAAQKLETVISVIIKNHKNQYLMVKKVDGGLLANLWHFPCVKTTSEDSKSYVGEFITYMKESKLLKRQLEVYGVEFEKESLFELCGSYEHVFSHIRQTHYIYKLKTNNNSSVSVGQIESSADTVTWMSEEEMQDAALSTLVRNVFSVYKKGTSSGQKRKRNEIKDTSQQQAITKFFKK